MDDHEKCNNNSTTVKCRTDIELLIQAVWQTDTLVEILAKRVQESSNYRQQLLQALDIYRGKELKDSQTYRRSDTVLATLAQNLSSLEIEIKRLQALFRKAKHLHEENQALKRELQIKIAEQATLEDVVQQKKMEIERLLAISGDNYAAWQRREAELQQEIAVLQLQNSAYNRPTNEIENLMAIWQLSSHTELIEELRSATPNYISMLVNRLYEFGRQLRSSASTTTIPELNAFLGIAANIAASPVGRKWIKSCPIESICGAVSLLLGTVYWRVQSHAILLVNLLVNLSADREVCDEFLKMNIHSAIVNVLRRNDFAAADKLISVYIDILCAGSISTHLKKQHVYMLLDVVNQNRQLMSLAPVLHSARGIFSLIYLRKMSSGYYDKCLSYVGTEIPILEAPTAQQTDRPFYATETTPYNAETQLNLHARLTRDWNDEFQTLIEQASTDSKRELQRVKQLRKLCEQFASKATRIGKIIISELNLPVERKTIKPITRLAGGAAGGAKFFHEDIFFKFPVDVNNLYGGEEGLMKACGHELKGLMSYVDCRIRGLHFPLMVIIDYQGWRLIAESVLPLGRDTIVYGSCDGGRTIRAESHEMNSKMALAAKILNIKGEYVQNADRTQRVFLHASCDVEGHLGRDGRYYIVDTARVMPPSKPRKDVHGGFLYQLLRPELLKSNPVALCPDSFSGFYLENKELHNQNIVDATNRLEREIVPAFAQSFEEAFVKDWAARLAANGKITESTFQPPNEAFLLLISLMHRRGINLRYLGLLRAHTQHAGLRRLLMTEMVARIMKHHLRREMRESRSTEVYQLHSIISAFCNKVFGNNTSSFVYWNNIIPKELRFRFYWWSADQPEKVNIKYELVAIEALFRRLQSLVGFSFKQQVQQAFALHYAQIIEKEAPFQKDDVHELVANVKHIHRIFFEEGFALSKIAVACDDVSERNSFLEEALKSFSESLRLKPSDYRSLHNIGYSLYLKATSVIVDKNLLLQAVEMFKSAIELEPTDPKSHIKWGNCLIALSTIEEDEAKADDLEKEAFTLYERAIKLSRNDTVKAKALIATASAHLQLLAASNRQPASRSSIVVADHINKAILNYQQAWSLGCRSFDLLQGMAIAQAKLARTQSGDRANEIYNRAYQYFTDAATVQPLVHELFFNWGNALYRQARMNLDTIFPPRSQTLNQPTHNLNLTTIQQCKLLIEQCISDAATKYARALELKSCFNKASINWVRAIKLLAEAQNKFNSILPPHSQRETALSQELRRFLATYKALIIKDPKGVSLDALAELSTNTTTEIAASVLVLLKELIVSSRRFPLEKSADLVRLIERIENSNTANTYSSFSQDWETPPFVESLAMDKSVLDDFEVLRQMNNQMHIRHKTTHEEFILRTVPNTAVVENVTQLALRNIFDPNESYPQPHSIALSRQASSVAGKIDEHSYFVVPIAGILRDFQRNCTHFAITRLRSAQALDSVLRRKLRLDVPTAQFIIAEIIFGLEFLHSRKIVYKCLRPSKILVGADGHIRLLPPLEFGSEVNLLECGPYLAPEILLGDSEDSPADQWTLGVLLYYILSGKLPFDGCTEDQIVEAVLNREPTFQQDIDLSAQFLIKSLLQKNPQSRFPSISAIKMHPFFNGFDWAKALQRSLQSPLQPTLREAFQSDISATIVFDGTQQGDFVGFTFASPSNSQFSD